MEEKKIKFVDEIKKMSKIIAKQRKSPKSMGLHKMKHAHAN